MASNIDTTQPPALNPTTAAMRANMAAAKAEIEALQALRTLGSNVITAGPGGVYPTSSEACEYLQSLPQSAWHTEIYSCSATVINEGKTVSCTGIDFTTSPTIACGDVCSFDGLNFYVISNAASKTKLTLTTPYKGSTIASPSAFSIYRPIRRSLILLPGSHDFIKLGHNQIAAHIDVQAMAGAYLEGSGSLALGQASQVYIGPRGSYKIRNIIGRASLGTVSLTGVGTVPGMSVVDIEGCDFESLGVDMFGPYGYLGKVTAKYSRFQSCQDGFMPVVSDSTHIRNCHLTGRNALFFNDVLAWNIRMFSTMKPLFISGSRLEIIHDSATVEPNTSSCLFDVAQTENVTVNNCDIYLETAGSAAKIAVLASPGSQYETTGQNSVFNNCNFNAVVGSGTKVLVQPPPNPNVYTGSGVVTLNHCRMNGLADGGNGSLTINAGAGRYNLA